ncbi:MAG: PTS sugar transporter subunit IIA [Liquorilactobacillus ghanensis]|uniref:PTS sugar transporter subunit IIA n=1 Tax=Liquorilactobacillus ghanensis TaxID=399370 RepID=UPI0039E74FFA
MKLILMSHGPLAAAMLTSAEMIIGKIKGAQTFSLTKEMGPEELKNQVTELLQTIPVDEQIIIGLDLLGGTPANVAVQLLAENPHLEVVTGINLPMVIEFGNQQLLGKFDLSQLLAMATGGITNVKEKLTLDSADEE